MKNKNKKILKWILIVGGIALLIYLISQGEGSLFSVTSDSVSSASAPISGGSGGIIR